MAKRRRSDDLLLLRVAGISDRAIETIINKIKARPDILDCCGNASRHQMRRLSNKLLAEISVTLPLQQESGETFDWKILQFDKILLKYAQTSPLFSYLLHDALGKASDHCLRAIVYHDEISSGNVLRVCNSRKVMMIYVGILEFGHLVLRSEWAWICIGALRHDIISTVKGGLPCIMKVLFENMFIGKTGMHSVGAVLPLLQTMPATKHSSVRSSGSADRLVQNKLVFCKMALLLADESALKSTFDFKGAAGLRPCIFCTNVVAKTSRLEEHDATQQLVTICEIDFSKCKRNSSEHVWRAHDTLQRMHAQINKSEFEKLEKAMGLNYNPLGLIACSELRKEIRPIECSMYESMHTFFSHGAASHELVLFLKGCRKHMGIGYDSFERFCSAAWHQRRGNGNPAKVFAAAREAVTHDSFRGIASEVLAVYGLVRHFAEEIIGPRANADMLPCLNSFRAMSDIVQILTEMKNQRQPVSLTQSNRLRGLQRDHMQLFLECYGEEEVKPKHHFCRHIPEQLDLHGCLYDVWALERKHRIPKQIGEHIVNTINYECSMLSRILHTQLDSVPDTLNDRLIGKPVASDALSLAFGNSAMFSDSMQAGGIDVFRNDVLLAHGLALRVAGCTEEGANLWLIVRAYDACGTRGHGRLWKPRPRLELLPANDEFTLVQHWTYLAENILLTLNS